MKAFLLIFLVPLIAFSAPTPTPEVTPSNAALRATVVHMQQLAKDQEANLAKEKQGHQAADTSLEATSKSLADATSANLVLQKQVQIQTDKLNSTQDKLTAADKKLLWYRLHWWGAWLMLGLGVAACIFFAILKVTGKLAVTGAVVASKVP